MVKTKESVMIDELVKAVPDVFKDAELGILMLKFGEARERLSKRANSQYFKWLYEKMNK